MAIASRIIPLYLPLLVLFHPVLGRNPSYLASPLGRASSSLFAHSRHCRTHQQLACHGFRRLPLVHTNSLLRRAVRSSSSQAYRLPSGAVTSSTRRYLLDFFNPLEPLELAWELYCNRYDILDELVVKVVAVTKRHSIKALAVVGGLLAVGEVLARVGILGKQGLKAYLWQSERFKDGTEERFFQKTSAWMVDNGLNALQHFHGLGSKSKFAISISAGALFGRAMIASTVICVKTILVSFFVLETLSFLGVIGDAGESILDWVEDEYERHASWTMYLASWHKKARRKMSLAWLEELYEAAVDEEKIASFGFSVGTVFTLLT
ncbi:hypothetical protein MHU86_17519 [Fragilaria crotonensis]|nr:hypothetical protein MHU86_17519 [Fragilaria crotonensis]